MKKNSNNYLPSRIGLTKKLMVHIMTVLHHFISHLWSKITEIFPTVRKSMVFMVILAGIAFFPVLLQRALILIYLPEKNAAVVQSERLQSLQVSIEKDLVILDRKLAGKIPRSYYLVINSSANEFSLYKNTQLIRKDKCSTGSYVLLKNGEEQQWMFKTPKGEFRIQGKTTSPVWKKPDWAFVEEGLPVPPPNDYTRYEYGVLGDYALSLGDGYLIHGTLYQRFLGLPVTHGCIRLNDENLKLVYNSMETGSKVYIY